MHLSSLTLRGFKSFASSTTLRFEPGITCVVGPNGSGKSNVVDAIAWVLGEQGAKTLRGGKMEDVIFAGTPGRPPLGRAEVVLTIDNSDGALPIDYTEVAISRLMYRSGESEYAINGTACRLLDVQELLSDSGIGRELHVIVGQGRLDDVLAARPEERRGFIEEAAGVLKHRRRKEKALRKLDAMSANLTRLADLTGELRRQLKPLGRQAEVARRAATVQADLRDARLRLLADDLVALSDTLEREVADETAVRERRAAVEAALTGARARESELAAARAAEAPRLARAQQTEFRLAALEERLRGLSTLAAERARHLAAAAERELPRDRDPDALDREADAVRAQERRRDRELAEARARLQRAVEDRSAQEVRLAKAERALVVAVQAIADRREGLARLSGSVQALRTRAAAGQDEIGRLTAALADARDRAERATGAADRLAGDVDTLDAGEVDLDERHEAAVAGHASALERVRELAEVERVVERDASAWSARCEALELGLARRDGTGALLAAEPVVAGLLGSVAALLAVEPGAEAAVAAALGPAANGIALSSVPAAAAALERLKVDDAGRAGLLVGGAAPLVEQPAPRGAAEAPAPDALPSGARWALHLVRVPPALRDPVHHLLDGVVVVDTLARAAEVVAADPSLRAATWDGDLLGGSWAAGGSTSAPSLLEVQAALDEARAGRAAAQASGQRTAAALAGAREQVDTAAARVADALQSLHDSDAQHAAVAEQLAQLGAAARAAIAEAERLARARAAAQAALEGDLQRLAAAEQRLQAAATAPAGEEPSAEARDAAASATAAARAAELEARLEVRSAEERARALHGRADALARAAADERAARSRHAAAVAARRHGAEVAGVVARSAELTAQRISAALTLAVEERATAQAAGSSREAELDALRAAARERGDELERLTSQVHRDEVARAEQRLRIEALEARAATDYGIDPVALRTDYGPRAAVPADDPDAPPVPYDRTTQEQRARRAERDLALLGKVNPLALEEFAALEERHAFLSAQLEDLAATRRDLLTVVREVDERIHEVFASAYADTAREFETVFATLFPGGEGRLVLTEPDDLLTSGIEVEARPPGKRVKRLSLLSGGERSLTAVALLVAIFRARPSPFYVLDEVEAALDDVNLGRLLGLVESLRESSQLLVITHQKRTMEIADALYGVSMRGDGITTVISQRLRERATA